MKKVPVDLGVDAIDLLDRLEELLSFHEDDDPILASSGMNYFRLLEEFESAGEQSMPSAKSTKPKSERKPSVTSPLNTPLPKAQWDTPSKTNGHDGAFAI